MFCRIIVTMICVLMGSCASVESEHALPTAKSVNLARYVGTWYEIARLPMWAQRNCARSMAKYWLLDSGNLGIRNSCITNDGEEISIEGTATIVDPERQAVFNVRFDRWWARLAALFTWSEQGNYWILRIGTDYQYAVVGTPDREFLWILARKPSLEEDTYQELVDFSEGLGFQTDNLIRRQPDKT